MPDSSPAAPLPDNPAQTNENLSRELQQIQLELQRLAQLKSGQAEFSDVLQTLTNQMSSLESRFAQVPGTALRSTEPGTAMTAHAAVGAPLAASSNNGQSGTFFDQLQGIPIDYLIATPLISAARGNLALAQVMTEFINTIGFNDKGATNLVTFTLDQPYQVVGAEPPEFRQATITVNAPLLSLVPLPALLVQNVTVDLTVQINNSVGNQQTTGSTSTVGATLAASAGWGWGSANFTGSYSNTSSTTSTSTQTASQAATYQVTVVAEQQPPTAGMLALSQIFANCIVPMQLGGQ